MRITLFLYFMLYSRCCFSQTAEEWTQQDKTQIKYLVEQIAAFQSYKDYVRKGYDIARIGISSVQNIKNGEWNLHNNFFGSLKIVNPFIKAYYKIADIVEIQKIILRQSKLLSTECIRDGKFSSKEVSCIQETCENLLVECLKNIDELILVTTSGELEMKDDERIKRIEKIYAQMQDIYVFFRSFGSSVVRLSKQRLHESLETKLSEKLNGIK